ncbi:MAG: hypothetical protein IKW74_08425, partial [Thermoguttaceae bacterium]|nr:hypothetical protein [Thermoguttaceae bacterium]
MRFWIFSPGAASISAIAFTFSGSILFQYSNPIFLVGAAWLPWAIAMGHSFIKQVRWGNFIVLVGILCMILLGGEPQTVYLTILLLFALLGVDSFYARRIIKKEDQTKQNVEKNFSQTTGLLFFSSNSR